MSSLSGLIPELRPYAEYLVSLAAPYGITVTSTYRSPTKQAALYAQYQATLSRGERPPYPVAPPGTSYHEFGRAFDVVGPPEVLDAMGKLWESWGGTWGGRFGRPDPIHFQA